MSASSPPLSISRPPIEISSPADLGRPGRPHGSPIRRGLDGLLELAVDLVDGGRWVVSHPDVRAWRIDSRTGYIDVPAGVTDGAAIFWLSSDRAHGVRVSPGCWIYST